MGMHPALWAIFSAHIAFNYGAYFITNWSPMYYQEVLGLSPKDAKWYLAAPHFLNLASKLLNPLMIKLAERHGVTLLRSRQLFTAVGFFGSAAVLLPVHQLQSMAGPWLPTLIFGLSNMFFGLAPC